MNLFTTESACSLRSGLSKDDVLKKLYLEFDKGKGGELSERSDFRGFVGEDGIEFHKSIRNSVKVNGKVIYPVFSGNVIENGTGSIIELTYKPNRNITWYLLGSVLGVIPIVYIFWMVFNKDTAFEVSQILPLLQNYPLFALIIVFFVVMPFFSLVLYQNKVKESIRFLENILSAEKLDY